MIDRNRQPASSLAISRALKAYHADPDATLSDIPHDVRLALTSAMDNARLADERRVFAGIVDWLGGAVIGRLPELRRQFGPLGLAYADDAGAVFRMQTLSGVKVKGKQLAPWDAYRYGIGWAYSVASRQAIGELRHNPRLRPVFLRADEITHRMSVEENQRAGVSAIYHMTLEDSVSAGLVAGGRTIVQWDQAVGRLTRETNVAVGTATIQRIAARSGDALVDLAMRASTYFPLALETLRQPPTPRPRSMVNFFKPNRAVIAAPPIDVRHLVLVDQDGVEFPTSTKQETLAGSATAQLRCKVEELPTHLGKSIGELVAEGGHIICPVGIGGGSEIRALLDSQSHDHVVGALWHAEVEGRNIKKPNSFVI